MKQSSKSRARTAARRPVEPLESRLLLAVFPVTNINDSGNGSLRDALNRANNTVGVDTISFNITSADKVIRPGSELPGLWDPTILDATTQPGYAGRPLVQIDGSNAGGGITGLKMWGGSTVKGLSITNFGGSALDLFNRGFGGNTIQANWIGADLAGNAAGNNGQGVGIWNTANNMIGGPSTADRNVISSSRGNGSLGVLIQGSAAVNNTIQNNYIGTDPTGALARGNKTTGVGIQDSPNNRILNNVISANGTDGVIILNANATGNVVQGNIVGLDATGTKALGNVWYGIEVQSANNAIGGTTAAQRNIFSANGEAGVVLFLGAATGNVIQGNYIGTDVTGNVKFGNRFQGVAVSYSNGNQIKNNLISGNTTEGIGVFPGNNNTITGNTIGFAASGATLLNGNWGVTLQDSSAGNVVQSNYIANHPSGQVFYNNNANTVSGNPNTPPAGTTTPGSFAFSASNYSAAENAGAATITVTRTANTNVAASVSYATTNGTAAAGSDYTAASGTLSFAAGETSKTFAVTLLNDAVTESDEALTLTLSNPTGGATLANPLTATVTITNDDVAVPGAFSLGSAAYSANENQGMLTVTVLRTANTNVAANVNYTTANGTALAGSDYTAASGTLSFAAGEISKTFVITLLNDAAIETPEAFTVSLSTPTAGATLGTPASAAVTLNSDDLPDLTPPKVTAVNYIWNTRDHKLRYTFSENVSATLSAADLYVDDARTYISYSPANYAYDTQTNTATFTFAGQMPKGVFRASLFGDGITDPAGNKLDGDNNLLPGGTHVSSFYFVPGDANHDGEVDFDDQVRLAQNYNTAGRTYEQGDFNYDGRVDFDDLIVLAQNYNSSLNLPQTPTAAAPLAAPTPAVIASNPLPVTAVTTEKPTSSPAPVKRTKLFSARRI
jgi:parallel beta-helix repeat protein